MGGCCKSQIEHENDVESIKKKVEKNQTNPNTELGQIYAELKFIADRLRQEDQGAQCKNEWKYVASVFDRLNFLEDNKTITFILDFVGSFILLRYFLHLLGRWPWVYHSTH